MRLIRRISLFLILSGIMLGLGGYTALKAEQFFYPNRYQAKETPNNVLQQMHDDVDIQEQIIEAAVEEIPVVTADTIYLIEEVDLSDGTVHETRESVPVRYIGLDREMLVNELEIYDNNPPLSELERGFETIELTAFSKDRVVICKYYKSEKENEQEPEPEPGYYLMVADHLITVYQGDRQTIYMNTDILLEDLSDELQAEIIQGKYMESEEDVFNFLESYSS